MDSLRVADTRKLARPVNTSTFIVTYLAKLAPREPLARK